MFKNVLKLKLNLISLLRFGQVSPRLKDSIPPLDFEDKQSKENDDVILRNKLEETPVPPL